MKLVLKGGRIIDPAAQIDSMGDVVIEEGKIVQVGGTADLVGAKVIEAKGCVIAPGLIDMHVHLREPGLEAKEDVASGTRAAAAGGFTAIACMPNTRPIVDNAILVAGLQQRAAQEGVVRVKVIGALTKNQEGKELAEIGDMVEAGVVAISDDGHYVDNARILRTGMEYTGMFGKRIISHAEDESLVHDGVMHEGAVSAMLGMKGRPAVGEDIAVSRDIMLAEDTKCPLHIAHVSSKGAVDLIRQAKRRGVPVTAEVTPHHLSLTDEAVMKFDSAAKVNPPLRSEDHRQALIAGLQDGTIDAIACDHAPHAFEEKDREFRYAPSGFAGLETSLGVVLTTLYHSGLLPLSDIVAKMSTQPAKLLGIQGGELKIGAPADIVIFDPNVEWTVDSRRFCTKGKHTPFEGWQLRGKAVATIVGGAVIMQNGEVYG